MTHYVDAAIWERHERRWCHLLADDAGELHAFAARLRLERRRFQSKPGRPWVDHYDIDEPRRQQAVALGAIEITRREVVELIARKRAAAVGAGKGASAGDGDGDACRQAGPSATASATATTPPSITSP